MKIGKTKADTLHLNGWGVGDILEGLEQIGNWSSTSRVLITCIGQETFLCRWDFMKGKGWQPENGNTDLQHRDWKKVGEVEELKRQSGFWGRFASSMSTKIKKLESQIKELKKDL